MRVLGIDYGSRKLGLALGDTDINVASPLEVWNNLTSMEETANRVAAFAQSEHIGAVAIGVPIRDDGTDSEQTKKNRQFAQLVRAQVSVPVVEVNEAYSSKESQRLQIEEGTDVAEDALAAMMIVQEYFDLQTPVF